MSSEQTEEETPMDTIPVDALEGIGWKRLEGTVVPELSENQLYRCRACGPDAPIPMEEIEWAYREEYDTIDFKRLEPKRTHEILINAFLAHAKCKLYSTERVSTNRPYIYVLVHKERRINRERRKA